MKARRPVLSMGPWLSEWGEPGAPEQVAGVQVTEVLLRRDGGVGTLVALANGRFAMTGSTTFAVGTAQALMQHARRRSRHPREKDTTWLLAVAEELGDAPRQTSAPR